MKRLSAATQLPLYLARQSAEGQPIAHQASALCVIRRFRLAAWMLGPLPIRLGLPLKELWSLPTAHVAADTAADGHPPVSEQWQISISCISLSEP